MHSTYKKLLAISIPIAQFVLLANWFGINLNWSKNLIPSSICLTIEFRTRFLPLMKAQVKDFG